MHSFKIIYIIKMKKTLVIALGLVFTLSNAGFAQKFGFCNSVALLTELPEVKEADSQLKDFQTQLTKKGQTMVQELQTKAVELEKKKEAGTISPKDYDTQMAKLQEEESVIKKYEEEVMAKLTEKRESLYKPILEKVNKAMMDVAKENQYTLVFDSSTQILLYADETLDVTKMVKVKLGIQN